MTTQCEVISSACNLVAWSFAFTSFNCSEAFAGDLSNGPSWNLVYFTDSAMTSNFTFSGVRNPYYFGLAALVNAGAGEETTSNISASGTPEIVYPLKGGMAYIVFCTSTLYDIEYDSVNNTITRFVASPSNDSVANAWQAPNAQIYGSPGDPSLQQASTLATFGNTVQELADTVALAYSRVALAIGAGAVMPAPALAVQERESFLVARVPQAPLFTLVVVNLLFVLLGIILAAVAIQSSGGEAREVQARLSIVGLVADRFEAQRGRDGIEKMDNHFEEKDGKGSMRVGIDHIDGGGYTYLAWPTLGH
jgi:hypothetical protein